MIICRQIFIKLKFDESFQATSCFYVWCYVFWVSSVLCELMLLPFLQEFEPRGPCSVSVSVATADNIIIPAVLSLFDWMLLSCRHPQQLSHEHLWCWFFTCQHFYLNGCCWSLPNVSVYEESTTSKKTLSDMFLVCSWASLRKQIVATHTELCKTLVDNDVLPSNVHDNVWRNTRPFWCVVWWLTIISRLSSSSSSSSSSWCLQEIEKVLEIADTHFDIWKNI